MRRARALVLGLLVSAPLFAADAKQCLELSARQDREMNSPSGILVFVTGYNRCSEDVDSSQGQFKVTALGPEGALATQRELLGIGQALRPGRNEGLRRLRPRACPFVKVEAD